MKITFDAIFMPPYTNEKCKSISYFVVSPETYELIIGFTPITDSEYFMWDAPVNLSDDKYYYQNDIFADRVNMKSYELMFANRLTHREQFYVLEMVKQLEKENKIKHINIEIEVR